MASRAYPSAQPGDGGARQWPERGDVRTRRSAHALGLRICTRSRAPFSPPLPEVLESPLPSPPPCPQTRSRDGEALTARLHADQLQLDASDGRLRALHHQLPRERLCDDAAGRVEVPSDEEFGEQGSLKRSENKYIGKVPGETTRWSLWYKYRLRVKFTPHRL